MPQEGAIVRNKTTGAMGRVVGGQVVPIQTAAPSPVIAPPDPYKQAAEQRAQQDQGFDAQRIQMEQERLRLAQQKAAEEDGPSADDQRTAAKLANLDALVGQINRVQSLYNQNLRDEAIPILSSLAEFLPTPENRQFDAAAAGMAEQGLAAFRVPGVGAQSDTELRQFVAANKPAASDYDASIEEKLMQLRNRVDANREALGLTPAEWLGGETEDEQVAAVAPPAAPSEGGNPTPLPFRPGDPGYVPADSTRTVTDPRMAAIADEYRQRLAEGQNASEIVQWLRSNGASPETLKQAVAQIRYRRAHPEVPIDRYNITSTQEVPLSSAEQAITGLGNNAAGAYALGAGQFLTGNTLDNISGDPERANLALGVAQAQNPTAYTAGEVSGGVMGALSGEAGLARLGMAPGLVRGAAADAAMGGANAAGAADQGGRVQNALLGALTGGAGSVGGSLAMRGVGNAISPTGGRLNQLYEAGVRPTPGQRFAESGVAGRTLNAAEEALQSVPVVGSAIRGAREEARDQFQVGAFNQALAEVGEKLPKGMKPGTDPHAYAQQVFDRVYSDARTGMQVVADEELSNEIGGIFEQVGMLAKPSQSRFKSITENVVMRRLEGGNLAGDGYKRAYSDLGKQIRGIRNNPSGDGELADALQALQGALDSAARRHSDPDAVALLDAADAGYAKLVRIEEAAQRAGGNAGTFSPTGFERSVQKTSGGTRSKAFLRGDALMQDYADQGKSLTDRLPNSGSADRVMAGYAVGAPAAAGAAFLEPTSAAALGAIGAAYAPGVRNVTKGVLAPKGPAAKKIAERLRRRARLVGAATAASGVAALPGTSPAP